MSIFDTGREAMESLLPALTEPIEYRPQGGAPATINARIGEKLLKIDDGAAQVTLMARRFIVRVADMAAGLPAPGDTIAWRGRNYRVGHPDGGPPWRWHGNTNTDVAIYAADSGAQ
jgi:hypothetical protein